MPAWITCVLIAIGLTALASLIIAHRRRWVRRAVAVQGEITEFRWTRGKDADKVPVICFTTADGTRVEYPLHTKALFDRFRVGDTVPILHAPNDPQDAALARIPHLYSLPLIVLIVAVLMLGVAVLKYPSIEAALRAGLG